MEYTHKFLNNIWHLLSNDIRLYGDFEISISARLYNNKMNKHIKLLIIIQNITNINQFQLINWDKKKIIINYQLTSVQMDISKKSVQTSE